MSGNHTLATGHPLGAVAQELLSSIAHGEDGVAVLSADGQLQYCNAACHEFVHAPDSLEQLLADWNRQLGLTGAGGDGPAPFNYYITSAGRQLRVSKRATASGGAVLVMRDRSDTEAELRAGKARVGELVVARNELLGSVSRRVRGSLNSILGFAQLFQRDTQEPLSNRQQARIEHMLQEGTRLLHLFDRVLELSRIDTLSPGAALDRLNVPEVIREVISMLKPLAMHANVRLELSPLPTHTPGLLADRSRLARILMRFGSNAIKFNYSGGSVAFRVSTSSEFVRVTVADGGRGISEPNPERLFEPFFVSSVGLGRADSSGLGLAIAKGLATSMNGRVGCRNASPNGAEFWLELPICDSKVGSGMRRAVVVEPAARD